MSEWQPIGTIPRNDLQEIIVSLVGCATIDGHRDLDGSPNPIDIVYENPTSTSGFVSGNDLANVGFVVEVTGLLFDAETGYLIDDLENADIDELKNSGALRITHWMPLPEPPQ